jgi:hypothetical protein
MYKNITGVPWTQTTTTPSAYTSMMEQRYDLEPLEVVYINTPQTYINQLIIFGQ